MSFSTFPDPTTDFAFKKIFGRENNKDILIAFLNDMLKGRNKSKIKDVTLIPTSLDPDAAAKKQSIVDVMCLDEKGNRYVVEMQVARDNGFVQRAEHYAAKTYTSQMDKGDEYEDLKEVIFLAIVDFDMFPKKKWYKSYHATLDQETHERDLKGLSFTFFVLSKFNKKLAYLKTMEDKWLYFLKHAGEIHGPDLKKFIGSDKIIERAFEELNQYYWSDIEINTYEQDLKRIRVNRSVMRTAIKDGIEIGEERGEKRGEKRGLRKTALRMLIKGARNDYVVDITGLSHIEVLEIQQILPSIAYPKAVGDVEGQN